MPIRRRSFLAGSLALATLTPGCTPPVEENVLRVIPHADLQAVDPIVTTAGIVQRHGLMVYDFLFALDANLRPQPQMVGAWSVENNDRDWRFVLREGLTFHDGSPVTADDVVASLRRWGARDAYGRQIFRITNALESADTRTVVWRLERPYGLLLHALAKTGGPVAAIMPRRMAETPPNTPLKEVLGSGPFSFAQDAWIPGAKVVYRRNPSYIPRAEPPSGAAGGKLAKVETVEWLNIRDSQSAVLALANGEVDFVENPSSDFLPMLRSAGAVVDNLDPLGFQGMLRMNHLHPPFDNPKARQALLYLIDQERYLQAMFGDPEITRVCHDFFVCGSQMATGAGIPAGIGKDRELARRLFQEAGYDGTPLVVLHPTDIQFMNIATLVLAEDLKSIGVAVDLQAMDFGAMGARRANKAAPKDGGWHLGLTYWPGATVADPVGNVPMQASCQSAWPGWPCDADHQALIDKFPYAVSEEERRVIAAAIQESAYGLVPYVPLGQWRNPVAYSPRLSGVLGGPSTMILWNIEKAA